MHRAFAEVDHRPWPLPHGPWAWRQRWCDLLFAHWPVDAAILRPLVPPQLSIQEFDGTSWVGIVPFRMEGVMRRPLPDLPGISAFPELNLRLYVEHGGKSGVWFISLDAANRLAVWGGRNVFHLPYFNARIDCGRRGDDVLFHARGSSIEFKAAYGPTSSPYRAKPGTLEHFLTERYCLYAESRGTLYRAEVHHVQWPLQQVHAEIEINEVATPRGIPISGPPSLIHFSRSLDVVVWPLERASI